MYIIMCRYNIKVLNPTYSLLIVCAHCSLYNYAHFLLDVLIAQYIAM